MHIFKWHNLGLISAILLMAAMVACRGETPPLASPPTSSPVPTMTSTPTLQPTPSPIDISETPSIATPPPEAPCLSGGLIEERVREALANWLGISSKEIGVVEIEEVEWPDTSLGCPEPGKVYAQVITPGFRVVLEAEGKTYEFHTDTGQSLVLCEADELDVCPMMPVFPHGIRCGKPRTPRDR